MASVRSSLRTARVSWRPLATLALCLLMLLGGLAGVISGTPRAHAATGLTSQMTWQTVVDDEFTTAGIPSHWSLYNGPYGSGTHNCAAPSQDSAPGDGYLYLTMSYLTSGKCGAGWYTGGMQIASAYDLPEQAITVRWRILPSADPSAVYSHHIIPMAWPDDPAYQWYQAEADYCESSSLTSCTTYLHDGQSSQISHSYSVDLTQWHTWRFEQVGDTLTVYIDDMTTPVWTYTGTATTLPDALRRAVLQQECPASACPSASYAGDSERIQIDSIQIAKPLRAASLASAPPSPVLMGFAIGYQLPTTPPWGDVTQEDLFSLQTTDGTALDTHFLAGVNIPAWTAAAHAHGVQALITIGGSADQNWQNACTGSNRAGFVSNLVNYMQSNGFDGIDLDIEDDLWASIGPPDSDMTACIEAISTAAKAVKTQAGATPYISADVITNWEGPWFAPSQSAVDQFNLMTYGDTVSSGSLAADVAATESQGLPAAKLVPGVDVIDAPATSNQCGPFASYAESNGLMGAFEWDEVTDEGNGYTCLNQFAPYVSGGSPAPTPTPNPSPSPSPQPSPTATPSPTPTPPPAPKGVQCIELVKGVMTAGTCFGTFTPKS